MRLSAVLLKNRVVETIETATPRIWTFDHVLALEVLAIVVLIFMKILVHGLFVAEKSKVSEFKYKIKAVESETKRYRQDLIRIKNREHLDDLSKSMNAAENIDVVIVK